MGNKTTNISIRIDSDLKRQADILFEELGMNITTAFNIFVRQTLREGKIPFDISINNPNKKTVAELHGKKSVYKTSKRNTYVEHTCISCGILGCDAQKSFG